MFNRRRFGARRDPEIDGNVIASPSAMCGEFKLAGAQFPQSLLSFSLRRSAFIKQITGQSRYKFNRS